LSFLLDCKEKLKDYKDRKTENYKDRKFFCDNQRVCRLPMPDQTVIDNNRTGHDTVAIHAKS
jgi:hypothetical protein